MLGINNLLITLSAHVDNLWQGVSVAQAVRRVWGLVGAFTGVLTGMLLYCMDVQGATSCPENFSQIFQ